MQSRKVWQHDTCILTFGHLTNKQTGFEIMNGPFPYDMLTDEQYKTYLKRIHPQSGFTNDKSKDEVRVWGSGEIHESSRQLNTLLLL